MAETIHTFTQGMDLDTEKALRSNTVTDKVYNFRISTDTNGTSGGLENVRGNYPYMNISTSIVDTVLGYCTVRNWLVLFGTRGTGGSLANVIYKAQIDDDGGITNSGVVYDDSLVVYDASNPTLDFTANIKAVGRYESEDIIKVYWVDGTNPIRFINIAANNTTDGEPYSLGSNHYMPTHLLEQLPSITLDEIENIEVKKGGSLQAGIVRYTYQFYNKYGAETAFIPLTNPIHITESDDYSSTSLTYKGSEVGTNTGKSVVLTIKHSYDNNIYDRLKVIRVHYTTYGGTPTINIVADVEVEKYFITVNKTYTIIDNGSSVGEYLPEEIAVLGKLLFSAKDINTKDDRLFCSNIEENYFDVDFDARAFRFRSLSTSFDLSNKGTDTTYTLPLDTEASWDAILALVGDNNDCINLANDLTYDDKSTYSSGKYNNIYQYNSYIRGGSGKNVKYRFVSNEIELDSNSTSDKSSSSVTANRTIKASQGSNSFTNYASPYISMTLRGYQRDEVYRFGIVFYDKKGRSSKVKWIGDIRFPLFGDTLGSGSNRLVNRDSSTTALESDALGIEFSVRNVPDEAVAWSIVRVERKDIDKTVISQGVIINLYNSGNYHFPSFPTTKTAGAAPWGEGTLLTDVLAYISPDVNYGDLNYKEGDYFETIGKLDNYGTYNVETASAGENTIKYNTFEDISSYNKITPNKTLFIEPPSDPTSPVYFGGYEIYQLVESLVSNESGVLGKTMLFTWDGTFTNTVTTNNFGCDVVNLRRINNSQYGGNTYENRFNNIYIPCGNIIIEDDSAFTRTNTYGDGVEVYGGDIFICQYERLHGIYDENSSNNTCSIAYIPLETKYNLCLNSGETYSKNVDRDDKAYLIKEVAGEHSGGVGILYTQEKDFYIYNTVYSYIGSPITYLSESGYDTDITEYDYRVIASNKKTNNEYVDKWTKFSVNDFIDVDSSYGSITNLISYRDQLYFLQPNALGILSINERAVVIDSNSANKLVVGTGGILDRYDYISTYYGNTNLYGVLSTESGIYWVDNNKSEMILFDGKNVSPLSKLKKIDSYFKSLYYTIEDVKMGYSPRHNEVWVCITADGVQEDTLIFSELYNCFSSFYTIKPYMLFNIDRYLVTIPDENKRALYLEDIGYYGHFYLTFYPSTLYLLNTDNYPYIKTYDNIEYSSVAKNSSDIDLFESTFHTLQVYNNYQNTDEITLTKGTNLERRERKWTLAIPRNAVNKNVSTNPDIFDSANLSVTNSFKERIRNDWAMFKFTYNNLADYSFSVPYIKVKYRLSNR
ncbi:MAG: hypothetical protein WC346_14665 [Methanogenium sp.]|jgi:hypothetical protein